MLKAHFIISTAVVIALFGCDNNKNDNSNTDAPQVQITPADINFTGVWAYDSVQQTYISSTDELIYTENRSMHLVMNDLPVGVRYSRCMLNDTNYSSGVKTDKNLYLDDYDNGFKVIDSTNLVRDRTFDSLSETNRYIHEIATIHKLSNDMAVSQGTVTVSGGGFLDENTTEVCVIRWHHPSDIEGVINLEIPYNGNLMEIRMAYNNGMDVGSYTQTADSSDTVELSLGAWNWFDPINTNYIGPASGTLTISAYDEQQLEGDFSFTAQDQNTYTGTFAVDFTK
jgi:hypothetical protein